MKNKDLPKLIIHNTVGHSNTPSLATKAGVFVSAGSVEEALSGAECAVFLVDHDLFRGISLETVKGLMASPVVVDGKNLFDGGGEGVVYLGIGKGGW